jgi:outer membrane protein assembly factor BamD (BamD/ComL family)
MESASCVKKVLSCKEDDRNLYAGLMCAVNFAERGRFREAIEVINVCKEAAPNNQQVLYNLAFLEYLNKNHEKSMTIIESYLQKYDVNSNEHIEMLYMLNKFKLKKFPEARRRMKLMILRNPN